MFFYVVIGTLKLYRDKLSNSLIILTKLRIKKVISDRFEDFVQSLRVFIEQKIKYQKLVLIDADEAVGNIELACKSMLDTFASLYDAARAQDGVNFDFYGNPLCCAVLAYRNAKHHNKANGIRSAYKFARQNGRQDYLLVDFPAGENEEGGGFIDHYASWADFRVFLGMPNCDSRLRAGSKELIRNRISAEVFESFAVKDGVEHAQVFINMIPIIIGSGSEFIRELKPHIQPQTTEAKHFVFHFENVETADFTQPQYTELTSSIFG